MGGVIVDAGNDCGGVGELVFFKEPVEALLKDLFVGGVGSFSGASQNFMRVRSSFVAALVILSGDPKIVDVSNLFVNFEVV